MKAKLLTNQIQQELTKPILKFVSEHQQEQQFKILEDNEKTISLLKQTRNYVFSIPNRHFNWNQIYSIKEVRKYKDIQKQININKTTLDLICNNFNTWYNIPTYLLFKDKDENLTCALASKRGNKIYEYYINKKLDTELKFMKNPKFRDLILRNKKGSRKEKESNVCFITLTCDTKKYNNCADAWINFQHDYNIFITRFRKKYGECWVMKSVESTNKGYPHIHLLIITKKRFNVFKPSKRKCLNCDSFFSVSSMNHFVYCPCCSSKIAHPYRMCDKKDLEEYWPSDIDILVPDPHKLKKGEEMNFMKDYIFKDMIKAYKHKIVRNKKNTLTLALNWLFGQRCYSISRKNKVIDLITDTSITQTQINEIIKQNGEKRLIFLGLVDFKFKSNKPPPISLEISKTNKNYEAVLNGVYGLRTKPTFHIIKEQPKTLNYFIIESEKINLFRKKLEQQKRKEIFNLERIEIFEWETIKKPSNFDKNQIRLNRLLNSKEKRRIKLSFEDRLNLAIKGVC